MNSQRFYSRPPTPRMIEKLKECLEKEKQELPIPCMAEEMKSSLAGLYKRGLIETGMQKVNGKRLLCIKVSEVGRRFLDSLRENNFPDVGEN